MSSRLVRMLLYLSMMQSSGGSLISLKIFLLIFLGILSYSCWYLDMAFLICFNEYSVVIFWASFLAIFALLARSSIHILCGRGCIGGVGRVLCTWLSICWMMGWSCQFGLFFVMYIIFRVRWYVARCFFRCFWSFFGR